MNLNRSTSKHFKDSIAAMSYPQPDFSREDDATFRCRPIQILLSPWIRSSFRPRALMSDWSQIHNIRSFGSVLIRRAYVIATFRNRSFETHSLHTWIIYSARTTGVALSDAMSSMFPFIVQSSIYLMVYPRHVYSPKSSSNILFSDIDTFQR